MEFLAGATSKNELRQTEKFLAIFTVIPISESISFHAVDLFKAYSLSHAIDIPDCFIAATALEHGMTLLTLNIKHFSMMKNLQLKKPY
jgi:predicted nucleic acid-binding protein